MQNSQEVLDTIGHIADFVGIISFILSGATLFIAGSLRKAMLSKIERKLFQDKLEPQINLLESYRRMLTEDPELLGKKFYTMVHDTLVEIADDYRNILPFSIKKRIRKLNKKVTYYLKDPEAKRVKNIDTDCKDALHGIVSDLRKERGLQ